MKRWIFYPKKIAQRYILRQIFALICALILLVLSLRHFLGARFNGDLQFVKLSSDFELYVLQVGALLFFLGLIYIFWSTYIYFYPLGRLLQKAKSIKRGTYQKKWDEEFAAVRDVGEWYEMELTLNKIHRELSKYKNETQGRQAEIESLAGAVTDGIIAIDPHKKVKFFNGQMALILGKTFDPLQPPAFLDEVFRAPKLTLSVDEVIHSGISQRLQIQMRPHKTNENHIFDVVVTPIKNEKKQNFGVIAVFHDVTELKKVEEVRIDFVANASHELKTPITSMKGYAQALAEDLDSGDCKASKEKLLVVQRNIDRLDQLVKDLLELSRLDSSGEASKEDIDLAIFMDEVVRDFKNRLESRQQKIIVDVLTPLVRANRVMLSQIVSNLLENATKYANEGSTVHVQWVGNDKEVLLKVADSGPGISEEHLSRLFERFYRVQNGKVKSGVSGTGLGLSIVKNSMLKHRGRVEVDSVPGKGTVFTCHFPKV